jgi:glycerol kinase
VSILGIDAGTTGVTALIVGARAQVLARGYQEFAQHFPQDGWVEHDPKDIWTATLSACRQALAGLGPDGEPPTAIGIANQRETVVLWDRETLGSPRRAIVWQDRRTSGICDQLRMDGHEPRVTAVTGLRLDPYFSGSKLTWLATNEPALWRRVLTGEVAIGTVDSYLVARLTRGLHHLTDASNASRTLLFDIHSGAWSEPMCALFGVPISALPEVVPSYGLLARTDPTTFLGLDLPITGLAGDQQAALFGQACFQPGSSKCTYGTGSFVLVNTGERAVTSTSGLLTTVAWKHPDGRLEYALEGAVFVTGAAVQWLRDGLGIITEAAESETLARSVRDAGGVMFVPALTGLGAPDWDPTARGTILGIGRGTTTAHLARATLDAIAYQVRDVVDLMTGEAGVALPELAVDGGASANGLLCELQSTALQVPVVRAEVVETTALGAALLAGLGCGVWESQAQIAAEVRRGARFEPGPRNEHDHRRWRAAVERAKGWSAI